MVKGHPHASYMKDLRTLREANLRFAGGIKLATKINEEVIKMPEKQSKEPKQHPFAETMKALGERITSLDTQIKTLKAERNALARALKGLERFY